ncbi:MAG: FtsW/RodA/SpoVE family cell cycle protein [Oscillospiraceae bacterium]
MSARSATNEQWPTYQQWRGRTALANGGFAGQGFLNGDFTQNGIVPYGFNDFIFVSIGEELGFLGCMAVILLLGVICFRCLQVARLSKRTAENLFVWDFAMIFTQAVINIGMCTSVLPVIGITLPFFSAGGTSLLCLYLGIGLVLNVYLHRNSRTIYLHDNMK